MLSSSPVYVDGGRWTISLNSRPVATRIADAIGDCGVVD
jgi:hypothetical protein